MKDERREWSAPQTALVLGSNDIASATALALAGNGFAVLMVEVSSTTVTRRGQSFADAAFDGQATLEGITAVLSNDPDKWARRASAGMIALTIQPPERFVSSLAPSVWVDARMRKRVVPEDQRGRAPLVIGLGPNFIAGGNVNIAVETAWGDSLGKLIEAGSTSHLAGEPKPIGDYGRERYVYSPAAGVFDTHHVIGQKVIEGEIVARIDDLPITAPKAGVLRGLVRDGVRVAIGVKVVEVVPEGAKVFGVGERPAIIASGVVAALRSPRLSTFSVLKK